MQVKDVVYTPAQIEDMFPCTDDEGQGVYAGLVARARAGMELDCAHEDIVWRCPDVFDVRYGSNYVATATYGDKSVRFLSTEGDFRQGDDE